MKACRSLFELLLTVKAVVQDPVERERYEDHRWVVLALAADMESARPVRQKGDLHWRRKTQRRIKPEFDRVIRKYGTAFKLGWRQGTLRDAATRYGLSQDYEFYRLTSAVLHGSSGGALGHYLLDTLDGEQAPVYRVGLALGLCPEGFERGLRYFRQIVDETTSVVGEGGTENLLGACAQLMACSSRYRRFLDDFDEQLWKTAPRGQIVAVAIVYSTGRCKWYLHDTNRKQMREAVEPDSLPASQRDALDRVIAARRSGRQVPGVSESEVLSMAIIGVKVIPKPNSHWRYQGELLQQANDLTGSPSFEVVERPPGWLDDALADE
ncbi:MAG: DUF5677 domain-containing protein [Actinobacteria bacterium]|nr:DUF5677 domain-containing protein [Actinomycetota bacterium]